MKKDCTKVTQIPAVYNVIRLALAANLKLNASKRYLCVNVHVTQ